MPGATSTLTEQFYTSGEVRQKLGISSSTLANLVDRGVIEKVVPPGRKNGYYTRTSVDDYFEQQNLFVRTYVPKKTTGLEARRATEADQPDIYDMETQVYGATGTIPLETRLEWFHKNPNIDIIVISSGQVVGHFSFLPLTDTALHRQIAGEIRGWDITADDIEEYKKDKQYNLFVMSAAVKQSEGEHYARLYAALLLREAQRSLFDMAEHGIFCRAIYATSRSRDGIYLAERMEFATIAEHSTARRKAFVLDMKTSNARWAREYRAYLASLKLPPRVLKTLDLAAEGSTTAERQDTNSDASTDDGRRRQTNTSPRQSWKLPVSATPDGRA